MLPHLLQRPVLGLARLIFGNGLQGPDLKDPLREVHLFAEILRRRPGHGGIGAVVKDSEEVIPPHAGKARVREAGGKQPLHLVQAHPVAVELNKPLLAAHDVVEAVPVPPGHIAGVELPVPLVPQGQLLRPPGVAHGHVWPAVDQLAHGVRRVNGRAVLPQQAELTAGHRHPHAAALLHRPLRGQVAHAGGRLSLAVHDKKAPSRPRRPVGKLQVKGLRQLAARLGQGVQRRQLHLQQARPPVHAVGVGHPGQGGDPLPLHQLPEGPLQHAAPGEHQRRPRQQVGVDDGHAVRVAHGQVGDGTLALVQLQVLHDRAGVGIQVPAAEAHQLGAAGAARGGEQEGQLRVELRPLPAGAAEQGAVLHLQRRDKALQHPPRLRREVAGHMDKGGAVGLQQAAQQLRRNVGVQQQGHFSRL